MHVWICYNQQTMTKNTIRFHFNQQTTVWHKIHSIWKHTGPFITDGISRELKINGLSCLKSAEFRTYTYIDIFEFFDISGIISLQAVHRSCHAITLPPVITNFRCVQIVNPAVIMVVWWNQLIMLAIYRGIFTFQGD